MTLRTDRNLNIAAWTVRAILLVLGAFSSFAWEAGDRGWAVLLAFGALCCLPLMGLVAWVFMPRRNPRTHSGAEIVSDSGPRPPAGGPSRRSRSGSDGRPSRRLDSAGTP